MRIKLMICIVLILTFLYGCASNLTDKEQIQNQLNKQCEAIFNNDVKSFKETVDKESPSYDSMTSRDFVNRASSISKKRFSKKEFKCTIVKDYKIGKNLKKGISERTQKDLKVKAFIVKTPAIGGKERFGQSVYIFRYTGGDWKYYVTIPIDIAKLIDKAKTPPEKLIDGFFNPSY